MTTLEKVALAVLALLPVIRLLDPNIGGVSPLLIFTIFVAILLWGGLQRWASRARLTRWLYFFLLSAASAGITQVFVQLEGRETGFSPNPVIHFFQALTIYMCVMAIWYVVLRRHPFTLWTVFWVTGATGIVLENHFAVLLSFDPLSWIFIFAVYGSFAAIPYLLTEERFSSQ